MTAYRSIAKPVNTKVIRSDSSLGESTHLYIEDKLVYEGYENDGQYTHILHESSGCVGSFHIPRIFGNKKQFTSLCSKLEQIATTEEIRDGLVDPELRDPDIKLLDFCYKDNKGKLTVVRTLDYVGCAVYYGISIGGTFGAALGVLLAVITGNTATDGAAMGGIAGTYLGIPTFYVKDKIRQKNAKVQGIDEIIQSIENASETVELANLQDYVADKRIELRKSMAGSGVGINVKYHAQTAEEILSFYSGLLNTEEEIPNEADTPIQRVRIARQKSSQDIIEEGLEAEQEIEAIAEAS